MLNDKGAYRWNAFRTRLVQRIADGNPADYENWGILETLLLDRGLITRDDIHRRTAEYRALKRDPVF